MSTTVLPNALQPYPLVCRGCGQDAAEGVAAAICSNCLAPLDVLYPADRVLPSRETIEGRARSLWRYREWLPFAGEPVHARDVGWTPLVKATRLAKELGVAELYIKDDSVNHPTFSYKDRVVSVAATETTRSLYENVG